MIEDALFQYSQLGFSYAVSAFLLWKGYKQDEKHILILNKLEETMRKHTEEKDKALALLTQLKPINCK